jgi:hypothetical protein
LIKLYDDIKNTILISTTGDEFLFKGAEILTKLREKVDTA